MPSTNIVSSQIAPQERWIKLYRKIHNLFLSKEFVHIADYNLMVQEMNARITMLETALQVELAKIQAGLATHIHIVPQSPTGANPSAPPVSPPYAPSYQPTQPVVPVTTAMQAYDQSLAAMGPALAPMGEGFTAEAIAANMKAQAEVGI